MGKLLLQKNRFMPGALKKSHLESGLNQQDRAKSAASLHSFLHKKCRLDDGHFFVSCAVVDGAFCAKFTTQKEEIPREHPTAARRAYAAACARDVLR